MDRALVRALASLKKKNGNALADQRYQKFRAMGAVGKGGLP
jgi:acetyl-CoA carboxylase carboxyl transferase subunit alpha